MVEYMIRCVDGCGQVLGKVEFPDGTKYPGDAHYGFYVPAHHAARLEADRSAETQKATDQKTAEDAALNLKVEAVLRTKGLIL